MKTTYILLFLFSGIFSIAQERKINAESTIQNVTVFSSGAQIQRTATVAITPGRSEVVFSGLSNQLEQQSVQLKADANITLLSVQVVKDYLTERKRDQDEKNLVEKSSLLKDNIDMDAKLLDVFKNEEAMLVKNQAIGGTAGVKPEELKLALDLQRQRLTEVYQKQLEIQKRIKVQQQEWERTKAQLIEIGKKRDSVNYVISALIDSKESRSVTFQLLYNIKDAGWYAVYDVRVMDVNQPLDMLMNANVFQRSGETWKNVSLQLSTGNPSDNATPSELQPWKLGFYDPSVAWMHTANAQSGTATGRVIAENGEPLTGASVMIKGARSGTVTDANGFFKLQNFPLDAIAVINYVGYQPKEVALKAGYFTIQLKPPSQALDEVVVVGYGAQLQGSVAGIAVNNERQQKKKEEIQTVDVVTQYQPTATVYKIEDKYTLETDGKTTTIGIKQISIPALYHYFTVPKIDPSVFLTAKVVNWQDYDLQSGEVNLYFEGTYLGKTYIDLAALSDTLPVSLGKDNSVKVSRKPTKEFSTKKFFGNTKVVSKQYELIVRNTKKVPITITMQDQFPVSTNKEIDVENTNAPDAQVDKESGLVAWITELGPNQEKKFQLGYSVKYPKDKRVVVE